MARHNRENKFNNVANISTYRNKYRFNKIIQIITFIMASIALLKAYNII